MDSVIRFAVRQRSLVVLLSVMLVGVGSAA